MHILKGDNAQLDNISQFDEIDHLSECFSSAHSINVYRKSNLLIFPTQT